MWWIVPLAAGLALLLGYPARAFGERFNLRSTRTRVATTGGLALAAVWWTFMLIAGGLDGRALLGTAAAMVPLLLVGLSDLRRPLGPWPQLGAQLLTGAAAVILGDITARYVTNPLGGLVYLDHWSLGGVPVLAAALSIGWIVALMNAVNFLDGMDGLAAAVSTVGFLTIGAVSLLPHVNEPAVALPAFIAAGAAFGSLFWNFPPARLYLGTPGAWFLGFLLAVLSVQGSSKIATLAVVGAIPLLDALSVVLARIRRGASPFRGDRTHLHHRLAARGWSPHAVLAAYTLASAILGIAAVLLPTTAKLVLLAASLAAVAVLATRTRRGLFKGNG